jgi:N6-L-threonylcarbamoyladenine synthase
MYRGVSGLSDSLNSLPSQCVCLGIETSCDETSVALWAGGRIEAELIHTQIPMHSVFGGVVPELASREHLRLLDPLVAELLAQAGRPGGRGIDLVAVTRGPGLLGALLVGIAYAKSFAQALGVPVIGVNHLHGHLLACELSGPIEYPALGLLVSGGHTHIYHMPRECEFELMGRTLDDAAGEAFDKIAKLLNLPYPGGKYIDELARLGTPDLRLFTKPYLNNDNCDFSFSGLKTAVSLHVEQNALPALDYADFDASTAPDRIRNLCATVNETIVLTLLEKTRRALKRKDGIRTLCLAGGVAANSRLREVFAGFAAENGLKFLAPTQKYCGDNGAMIAYTGVQLARRGLASPMDFEAIPRGRNVPDDYIVNPYFKE